MRDLDIRNVLLDELEERFRSDASTLIVPELGIQQGSVRADVAVVNGRLHGYEIKSAVDTLARLPTQVDGYSAVFDRVTLIAADRHVDTLGEIVPPWWELVVPQSDGARLTLMTVRLGCENPAPDALSIAQLLWPAVGSVGDDDLAWGRPSSSIAASASPRQLCDWPDWFFVGSVRLCAEPLQVD